MCGVGPTSGVSLGLIVHVPWTNLAANRVFDDWVKQFT